VLAKEKGIVVKNTPTVVILPVVELTIAMMFDLLRKLTYFTTQLRSGTWVKKPGYLLSGRKVGIIGLGQIGKEVTKLLLRLNARVYGYDINPDESWAKSHGVAIVSKEQLLGECDIVSLHVSSVDVKDFIIGKKEINGMKNNVLFINTSRGKYVDEKSLYAALSSGHIGGAALDVFSQEPYFGDLCTLENVILTPHIATLTKESRTQMEIEAVQNALDFIKTI